MLETRARSSVTFKRLLTTSPRKLCKATTHTLTSAPRASFTRFSHRYGWYKHDSGGNLLYKDQDGNKITDWYPDMFKTKDGNWHEYDPSCIHLACDQNNIEWNGSTWYCN